MNIRSLILYSGTGYIGSFTTLALLEAGYEVIIVDNLYNSHEEAVNRIELICGKRPKLHNVDITDEKALDAVFEKHPEIDSVIHFAALKAVGESGEKPLEYYRVNVAGTITLLSCMTKHNVTNIVFSSSATVYGDATRFEDMIPIPEVCPLGPTNPYGNTKVTVELLITDHVNAKRHMAKKEGKPVDAWNGALLRYFNPAGAHPSGIMGEDPQGIPFNLLPLLAQVAVGKRKELMVFGDGEFDLVLGSHCMLANTWLDYDSKDGTAIRDYIHILDLAEGHVVALNHLRNEHPGVRAWNLGTGRGSTVFDIVKAFSKAVGRDLPYKVVERRQGDVLNLTANPTRANEELEWKAVHTLEEACESLWRWTENNPQGYRQQAPQKFLDKLEALRKEKSKKDSRVLPASVAEP